MNRLLEENIIEGMASSNGYSYILKENNQFLATEYKVLQNQAEGCFLKCMKMLYNGKIQIYYLTEQYVPFEALIPTLDAERFLAVVSNLLKNILHIRKNGFLSCRNIDISFEHIYVEANTLRVALMYLPANIRFFADDISFESELRTALIKAISDTEALHSQRTSQFAEDLSNGMLGIEALILSANGNKDSSAFGLKLVGLNTQERIIIDISKDGFVLGKKAEQVDYVLHFNKMISRVHCVINKVGNTFYVTDLQSANGTYVNKRRLQPNIPQPICNGDIVRLADSDFQVRMDERRMTQWQNQE